MSCKPSKCVRLAVLACVAGLLLQLAVLAAPSSAGAVQMSATVKGKVTDTAGVPIPDCEVYLHHLGNPGWHWQARATKTDANGMYSITDTWESNDYTLTFATDYGGYSQGRWRKQLYGGWQMLDADVKPEIDQIKERSECQFQLSDGETKTLNDVRLKKYSATIKGRVTSKTGAPIVGVSVMPLLREDGKTAAWDPLGDVFTAADGSFSMDVPPTIRPEQRGYVVHFAKTNLNRWQPTFLPNIPSQEEWQGPTLWTIQTQALQSLFVPRKLDSEESYDASIVLAPLIKETVAIRGVSPSAPRRGRNFTVTARLTPGHDFNTPVPKVQLTRYNTKTRRWVAVGLPKPMRITARKPGSVEYKLVTRVTKAGKYRAAAIVGKHWSGSAPHVTRRSAARAFAVR